MYLICLHNIIQEPPDVFDRKCSRISAEEFERFVAEVSEKFELISYSAYESRLSSGDTHPNCVALSFDDGFAGVYDGAKPILDKHGIDAIAFINPPFVGNPRDQIFHFLELEIAFRLTSSQTLNLSFVDGELELSTPDNRVKALKKVKKLLKTRPEDARRSGHHEVLTALNVTRQDCLSYAQESRKFEVMDKSQLGSLSDAGWTIGSHGMTHRTLSMLSTPDIEGEVLAARDFFLKNFGLVDIPFAYPYGDVIHVGNLAPKICARAGHPMAYTTVPGQNSWYDARYRLPRIDYKLFVRKEGLLQDRV